MKKFTLIVAALAISLAGFAQPASVTSIEIAGRACKGTDAFGNSKPFTKVSDGIFVYYGYLYNSNPEITNNTTQNFKLSVNRHIGANTDWNNGPNNALVASVGDGSADNVIISAGSTLSAYWNNGNTNSDKKWKLAADAGPANNGEGWFKITVDVSNLSAPTVHLDDAEGSFADLAGISAPIGGALSPAFDPAVTTYTLEVPESFNIYNGYKPATLNHYNTSVAVGAADLTNGLGTSTIVVTSLDGSTTKDYTVNCVVNTSTVAINGENKTSLIVNNDFDYVAAGVSFIDGLNFPTFPGLFEGSTSTPLSSMTGTFPNQTYRPLRNNKTTIDNHLEFYGWTLSDWTWLWKKADGSFINSNETSPNESLGINVGSGNAASGTYSHGSAAWLAADSKTVMPEDFEFYQTITAPGVGTYRLSALLVVDGAAKILTSQRVFAQSATQNNVQYFGKESDYGLNLTVGEEATYAGYSVGNDAHRPMKVYVTVGAGDNLKIGIRSGNRDKDGNNAADAGNTRGWFKMDYFRLIKLDPDDAVNADLSDITLSAGTLVAASQSLGSLRSTLSFAPATTTYDVELPEETTSVTAVATAALEDVKITGDGTVDVSGGSAQQVIVVTALDGTTKKTYTINYSVKSATGINVVATGKVEKSAQYYSLTGIAVPATTKGLLLKKTTYTDGSVKVEKVVK